MMQLGTCVVTIDYKDNKKKCEFFVVPRNGQVLLGMPDTAGLNIINVNIDSIEAASMQKENCNTNIGDTNKPNIRQETHVVMESCTNMDEDLKIANNVNGSNNNTSINTLTNYFLSSPNMEVDKWKSIELIQKYTMCVIMSLIQKLDIITPLGVDKTVEWFNSFVLVPKANGKVRLCLDLARLNQALIRPVHRGPMLNDTLPGLNNVKYMSIIATSLGYHNLKLDEKSLYLTTFTCPFGQYQYKQLPFRAVPASNMFQCKIDKIFSDMPNVFGIADDILVVGYVENGADHDAAAHKVLQRYEEVNLKLNKEKCHFRCTSIPFFGEVILRKGAQPDPQKIKTLTDMPVQNNKKELQAFLSIINYPGKFSPGKLMCVTTCTS